MARKGNNRSDGTVDRSKASGNPFTALEMETGVSIHSDTDFYVEDGEIRTPVGQIETSERRINLQSVSGVLTGGDRQAAIVDQPVGMDRVDIGSRS